MTPTPYANESQSYKDPQNMLMIFSTHRQAFCFLCLVTLSGLPAFWGSTASKSKIVEEVKIEPGRGFKGYRRKMHFCENALRCYF